MALKTAYSRNPDVQALARELVAGLGGPPTKFALFFVAPEFDTEALGAALSRELGGVPSIGCTTAGELAVGRMLKNSAVIAGFDDDVLDGAAVALLRDLSSEEAVSAALGELARASGGPLASLDPSQYVGLVLHDGLSVREEAVMAALSTQCNVPFIGGSAGDNLKFQSTRVFINGVPHSGASVLALLKPSKPYGILKTQSFDVLDATLVVSDADEKTRTVHAFNGRPAVEEYARVLGVSAEELPGRFQSNPVGLIAPGGEPFVRSPMQVKGTSLVFYCQVTRGMELKVLQSRNIVADTKRDLKTAIDKLGGCHGVLNFHCILRTLELEQRNQTEDYGAIFADLPMLGFSTYGECYVGHINQTSTMVLFG